MGNIDWRMILVLFNVFQFIFMAVIFAVLKFNDLKHLDEDVQKLSNKIDESIKTGNEKHLDNLKAISDLTSSVTGINERCKAINNIKD